MSLEARLLAVADLSASERVDLIAHLVESWYGPPVPGDRLDIAEGLPSTLRLFHAKIGGSLPRICRQNTLLRPGDVYESDELLVIALENQGVYAWATRAMEDDPPIFGCFQGDEPWTREASSLSVFLLGFVVFELIMGAPYGASVAGLGEGALEAVLAHMAPLSLPAWRWPDEPGRFFVRGQAFAFCAPDSPDTVSLWVGGRAPGDVAFLAPFVSPDWNRVAL
jgi:hypothetical protein